MKPLAPSSLANGKTLKALRMLARRIIPAEDIVEDIGNAEADAACEEFLDFCQNDPGVAGVCFDYELGREDLTKLYWMLRSNGAGHWVRGHYVALSTLAYAESLSVCADLHRRGVPVRDLCSEVLDYWLASS